MALFDILAFFSGLLSLIKIQPINGHLKQYVQLQPEITWRSCTNNLALDKSYNTPLKRIENAPLIDEYQILFMMAKRRVTFHPNPYKIPRQISAVFFGNCNLEYVCACVTETHRGRGRGGDFRFRDLPLGWLVLCGDPLRVCNTASITLMQADTGTMNGRAEHHRVAGRARILPCKKMREPINHVTVPH